MIPGNADEYTTWLHNHPTALAQYAYAKKHLFRYKEFDSFYQRPPLYEVFHGFLKVNKVSLYKVMHPIKEDLCTLLETQYIADIRALHHTWKSNPLTEYQRYLFNSICTHKSQRESIYMVQLVATVNNFDITYYDFENETIVLHALKGLEYWWAHKELRTVMLTRVHDADIDETIRSQLIQSYIATTQEKGWWQEEIAIISDFLESIAQPALWPHKGNAFSRSSIAFLKDCLPDHTFQTWSQYLQYNLVHDVEHEESWIRDLLSVDETLSWYDVHRQRTPDASCIEVPLLN